MSLYQLDRGFDPARDIILPSTHIMSLLLAHEAITADLACGPRCILHRSEQDLEVQTALAGHELLQFSPDLSWISTIRQSFDPDCHTSVLAEEPSDTLPWQSVTYHQSWTNYRSDERPICSQLVISVDNVAAPEPKVTCTVCLQWLKIKPENLALMRLHQFLNSNQRLWRFLQVLAPPAQILNKERQMYRDRLAALSAPIAARLRHMKSKIEIEPLSPPEVAILKTELALAASDAQTQQLAWDIGNRTVNDTHEITDEIVLYFMITPAGVTTVTAEARASTPWARRQDLALPFLTNQLGFIPETLTGVIDMTGVETANQLNSTYTYLNRSHLAWTFFTEMAGNYLVIFNRLVPILGRIRDAYPQIGRYDFSVTDRL